MTTTVKRVLSVIMVLCVCFSTIPFSGVTTAQAAGTGLSLAQLRQKFPHGKYWNHAGNPGSSNSVNNQNGYTSTGCTVHGVVGTSRQTCNGFQPGGSQLSWQCMGYAEKLGYDATGYNPRNNANGWQTYTSSSALNNLKAGDIVRYKNNGHSIYVTAVNGDTVTYTDCNSDGHCIIRWDVTISKSTLRSSFTHVRSAPSSPDQGSAPAPDSCSCSTAYAGDYVCSTASANLNIRSTHSTSGSIVGSIPKGATVHISKATGTGANDWGHVSYNGASGYVSMQYMQKKGPAHADAPTLNWWLSDSAYGNAVSDFRVGNRYYFCYKLHDSVTGKPWDEVSSDNYSVRIAIYNPDGSLNYDSTYNSDDDGWISIYYQNPGTYTRKITISGDFLFEGSDTFYVAPDPKKIHASASTVNLTVGGTESTEVLVWTSGYYDASTFLNFAVSNNNVSCRWGDRNSAGKYPLYITAKSCGTSTITLSVKDSDTASLLHSIKLEVKVNGNHSYKYSLVCKPTTSSTGQLLGVCSGCGKSTVITIPVLSTSSYSYSEKTAATCTKDGVGLYTWKTTSYGTYSFELSLPAKGHSWRNATCTFPKYCSECGITSGSSLAHTYTNECDISCNVCGNIRLTSHSYVGATCTTPETCKVCSATSGTASGHSYTNACDTSCNVCNATRTTTHSYKSATCTSPQTCTVCGVINGSSLGHTYTNTCDAYCNRCSAYRTVTHNYKSATCTSPKTCTVCGSTSGTATGHSYTNACDTSCNVCFATRTAVHSYKEATCQTPKTCTLCGVTSGSVSEHKYSNSCDELCNYCNAYREITHSYYPATCTSPQTCMLCGATSGGTSLGHSYTNSCDSSCNRCGYLRSTSHTYKTVTTKATLTSNGNIIKMCTACSHLASVGTIYSPVSFTLSQTSYTFNGKVKTPTVTVKDSSGKVLTKDVDYTVSYSDGRINAGTYNVTVTMKGNYTGTKTLSFRINPIDISTCKVKLSDTSYTFNGKVKTPEVSVINAYGTTLKAKNYTVSYSDGRVNAGTYNVTVTMKGNYTGTKTLSFRIKPIDISTCTVKLSATVLTYNGNVRTPAVSVINSYGTTLKAKNYTVTYQTGRKNVGTYKVTVTMKGNYTGTKTLTFKINPPKTTVASLTAGAKKITVNIKKQTTQTTGYQIQYATNKDFTNAKTKLITSNTTLKTTLSGLSSAKTYYVRVRTYKTVNNVKYYSGWSAYKYVKSK